MRNFISILLIVVFVPATLVTLLVFSLKTNVLTPGFLKRELSKNNVYALATSEIDEHVRKLKIDPQYPITHDEIINLIHQVFPETWVQQRLERIIDDFFAWWHTPVGTPLTLPIDIQQPKAGLFHRLDELLAEKISLLQPCPRSPRRDQSPEGICLFAGLTVTQAKEAIKHAGVDLVTLQTRLPDVIDLINPDFSALVGPSEETNPESLRAKNQEIMNKLNQAKARYHQFLWYYAFGIMTLAIMILGYAALQLKNWRRFARWLGILAVAIGLLPLTIGMASQPLLEQQLIPQIRFDAKMPAEVQTALLSILRDVQRTWFTPILWIGFALVVVGLTGIIGSHFFGRAKNKDRGRSGR